MTRWTAHGTNSGELLGMPATGKASTVTGIAVDHIVNGTAGAGSMVRTVRGAAVAQERPGCYCNDLAIPSSSNKH